MWAGMPGIFLRQIHEKQYPASLEPYTGNILLIAVTYDNGQVFQHFGHTEQFKIYEVEDGKVVACSV